jgi:hypothetical protein
MNSKTAAYLLGETALRGGVIVSSFLSQAEEWEAIHDAGKGDGWRLRNQRTGRYFLGARFVFCDRDHVFACWLGLGKKAHYELIQVINPVVLANEIFDDDEKMETVAGDILVELLESLPDNLLDFPGRE